MRALLRERPPDEEDSPAPLAGGNRASPVRSTSQEDREQDTKPGDHPQPGAFATAAADWWHRGFAPLPLGGLKGNEPLVGRFNCWKRRPSLAQIREWAARWPDANIGILTGPTWNLTVIDIDDPAIVAAMLERFGESPFQVRTPRGGLHVWFRSAGERCANLRPQGLDVDIKGPGGYVVAPPSIRPTGEFAGRRHEIAAGCLDSLKDLPAIKPGALVKPALPASVTPLRAVRHGSRNTTLLRLLLRQVRHCDDLAALVDVGRTIAADQFEAHPGDPFDEAEILRVATSAWEINARGNNWVGREALVITPASIVALDAYPLKLMMTLRTKHFDHARFAVSPRAMAVAGVIPRWKENRYRAARQELLDLGYLVLVHEGGSKLGDPSLFAFGTPQPHTVQNLHTI